MDPLCTDTEQSSQVELRSYNTGIFFCSLLARYYDTKQPKEPFDFFFSKLENDTK